MNMKGIGINIKHYIKESNTYMQPIKDRDCTHVILLEDGSYWMSGGFGSNKDGLMSTLNLSSATFLSFEDACYKADKLREKGRKCDVLPVLLMIDD